MSFSFNIFNPKVDVELVGNMAVAVSILNVEYVIQYYIHISSGQANCTLAPLI